MKYWGKTTLSTYKYLPSMIRSIDKAIVEIGKNSNSPILQKFESTYFQANKIIELMDRKRKMINLKVAVEQVLQKLDMTSRQLLLLVYVDGLKSEAVADLLKLSLRTYFRKKLAATNEFNTLLKAIGYDEGFFESEYGNENWFQSVYNACVTKNYNEDLFLDTFLIKRVFSEVSKIKVPCNLYL